jgi:hypothetical protein
MDQNASGQESKNWLQQGNADDVISRHEGRTFTRKNFLNGEKYGEHSVYVSEPIDGIVAIVGLDGPSAVSHITEADLKALQSGTHTS